MAVTGCEKWLKYQTFCVYLVTDKFEFYHRKVKILKSNSCGNLSKIIIVIFCRFVQGVSSCDCYVIYHWQLIDIFVYFSHHFVTIPPPCWTNSAHTHGVPVLGTLITESDDGVIRCSKILEDEASLETVVNQLVDIAEYYRFDGWLLNIENPIQVLQISLV